MSIPDRKATAVLIAAPVRCTISRRFSPLAVSKSPGLNSGIAEAKPGYMAAARIVANMLGSSSSHVDGDTAIAPR